MSAPRLLSNRYELGDTLGYGGMSEVHHGHDIRLGREVAVKILRADLARDPMFQERFRREAQNAAALNHPAIVAVYDTGEAETEYGPLPYIVMEYVEGRTLRDIVKTEGPMPQKRAMEVMADVCAALDFSHRHGIIHRDVKPANVMITRNGAVKVMDFGIARAVHDGQAAMTQTAAVIGTAQYLSPEQARGETVDARSDVYSSGCVLYELVTGDPPFTGDSPVAVAYQHVREAPRAPSESNPAVSPELDAVVLKALAKSTSERYQSAAEMRSDLVRTLSGQRPMAPMVGAAPIEEERTQVLNAPQDPDPVDDYRPPFDDADDARKRRRRRALVAAAVTVLALGAVAFITWINGGFKSAPEQKAIPDVTDVRVEEAKQQLRSAGFQNVRVQPVVCLDNPPSGEPQCTEDKIGNVIGTDPPPGRMVTLDTEILLRVGTAPDKVEVPDLSGLSQAAAEAELQGVNLTLDPKVTEVEVEDESLYGKVVDQNPPAGKEVEQGHSVSIKVGKEPKMVEVPNMTGKSYEEAKATLEGLGFVVLRNDVDNEAAAGTVIAQEPNGGSVEAGSQVTLDVSNGSQEKIQIPDLKGMTQQEAVSALHEAGWEGTISEQTQTTSDKDMVGKVISTNPGAGSSITKDREITLVIGADEQGSTEPSDDDDDDIGIPGFR
ncbi:Stk1 family PASTA domain-containing Ser/Thr kinase [Saccharomonospora xinjiangensis]|uniref:non-specific serine/threonine protein kinase n=1 Tax=Saccharomonospora xinjiangensis XJ-54 TaxID=882086 RepID=I0V2A9_9PSEU|nr:Stk1 family PASTA domain-containing Ser/Thr kinase [Saccharomonospora xinjiangensis]EID54262.1 protein kinase family protein with PASTA domain [Saccharomonospora xinjiangensis XJ-54]